MKKEYDFSKGKRGAVIPRKGKSRISIYLCRGYQTMINDALREYLGKSARPLDVETLRRILREELKSAG